jgi:hypothetical protein
MVLTDKKYHADCDKRARDLLLEISNPPLAGEKNRKILTNHLIKGVIS